MTITILTGCCLSVLTTLPAKSINTCVTSPPYWGLRDYGIAGQLGLEPTPEEFVSNLVALFREVRRVLRDDGTLWLNLGDSYIHGGCGARDSVRWPKQSRNDHVPSNVKRESSLKPKNLVGIPWRVALALQADCWYLRSDIIWHKPTAMPESVSDRPMKSHEYIFLLTKSEHYYYDCDAIREPLKPKTKTTFGNIRTSKGTDPLGKIKAHNWSETCKQRRPATDADGEELGANKRTVWTVASTPLPDAHFATYPPALIEPCILAGCPAGGTVLDPFFGAGTTGLVADRHGRHCVGIELNPEYVNIAEKRLRRDAGMFADIVVPA